MFASSAKCNPHCHLRKLKDKEGNPDRSANLYDRNRKRLILAVEVSAKRYPALAGGFAS